MSIRRRKGRGSVETDISCAEMTIKDSEETIRWATRNLNEAKEKLAIAKEKQRRMKAAAEIINAPYEKEVTA
jgi:hypothetical protein